MSVQKKAFLLVGSLRGAKSTSEFIGSYLLNLLDKKGFQTEKMYIGFLQPEKEKDKLISCLDYSDVVIFSSPLYIDCEPYLMIKAMEAVVEHRRNSECIKKTRFLVISNGGYPEALHNDTVLSIYRNFALEAGFEWLGGLVMGMGAAISVPIIRKIDMIIGNIKRSLEMTVEAISNDERIPEDAIRLMREPLVPIWLYSFVARSIARFFSITNRAGDIYARPL